jgi:hypothetical protein
MVKGHFRDWRRACVAIAVSAAVLAVVPQLAGAAALSWTTPQQIDPGGSVSLDAVTCPSAGLCVAVTSDGAVATTTAPGSGHWTITDIGGGSDDQGDDDGSPINGISCPSTSFCAAVDQNGYVFTTSDPADPQARWTSVSLTDLPHLESVTCASASLCILGDDSGDVISSSDPTGPASAWHAESIDSQGYQIDSIACPSTGLCVAVGADGGEWYSTNPLGGSGAWTADAIDGGTAINSVTCPSTSLCVAVDADGNALATTAPASSTPWRINAIDSGNSLNTVSCPSAAECVAGDSAGDILSSASAPVGTGWQTTPLSGGHGIDGVSCPSAGLCVAVDGGGSALVSGAPTSTSASAWSFTQLTDGPGQGLDAISCPTAGLCVAVDGGGQVDTSTDPTGGPLAWTVTPIDSKNELDAVSCPTVSLCVAVDNQGNVITSTTPTGPTGAWAVANIDSGTDGNGDQLTLNAVSCASASFCVAADDSGNVFVSTDPTGGAAAWAKTNVAGDHSINGVSCPAANLCAVVDGDGNATVATNPGGGAAAWTTTHVDGNAGLDAVSCSGAQCVAADGNGGVVTTTAPTTGAWSTPAVVDSGYSPTISAIDCPSSALCAASDESGNMISTDAPLSGVSGWTTTGEDGWPVNGISCPSSTECLAVDGWGGLLIGTPPAPTPVSPGTSTQPKLAAGKLKLTGNVVAKGATVTLHLTCTGPAGEKCTGTLKLTVRETVRGRRVIAVAAQARKRTVRVGGKTIRLAAGATSTVHLGLNRTGTALLRSRHHFPADFTVYQGRTRLINDQLTLRKPARKPKKKHKRKHR